MNIDLRKTPEGATHWAQDSRCYSTGGVQFYKNIDGHWFYWGESFGSGWRKCIKPCKAVLPLPLTKSLKWNGEELPPIDSIIRIDPGATQIWDVAKQFIGVDCYLKAVFMCGETKMVAVEAVEIGQCCCFWASMVRTPEQIAAEERKAAVTEMLDIFHNSPGLSAQEGLMAVYNAGYRKQVIDD